MSAMSKRPDICIHISLGGVAEGDHRGEPLVNVVRHDYHHPDANIVITRTSASSRLYGPHHPTVSNLIVNAVVANGYSAMRLIDYGAHPNRSKKPMKRQGSGAHTVSMFGGDE